MTLTMKTNDQQLKVFLDRMHALALARLHIRALERLRRSLGVQVQAQSAGRAAR